MDKAIKFIYFMDMYYIMGNEYDLAIESIEKIISSMNDAVKEMWSAGYSGMMVSVGRVFANEATKKSLAEDIPSVLKEISANIPGMEFEYEEGKIIVKKCIVRELAKNGVTELNGPLCAFMKGYIMKMIENVVQDKVKLNVNIADTCEITLG